VGAGCAIAARSAATSWACSTIPGTVG
jgi:hypothetical protein